MSKKSDADSKRMIKKIIRENNSMSKRLITIEEIENLEKIVECYSIGIKSVNDVDKNNAIKKFKISSNVLQANRTLGLLRLKELVARKNKNFCC
jgi:hypothetical protein